MYSKDLVKLLEKNGWIRISQSGSHLKMRKRKSNRNYTNSYQRAAQRSSSNNFKENGTKIVPPLFSWNIIIQKIISIKKEGVFMNNYFYPAIFTYDPKDEYYIVDFIDLKGCSTIGKSIEESYLMAQDALGLYLSDLTDFPKPTIPYHDIPLEKNQFISIVEVDILEYRKKYSNIAIKKTLTIPTWLNTLAEKNDINFSQLLQRAIKKELNILN